LFNGSSIGVEVLDDDEISVRLYFDYNLCCFNLMVMRIEIKRRRMNY
jgi:hypothetical protein